MSEFKMPQLGESVTEGTVTRWLKKAGEPIAMDEALVEVSTDKVDSEVPSPAAGTFIRVLANEGDTVAVGAVIAEIDFANGGDAISETLAEETPKTPTGPQGPQKPDPAETDSPVDPSSSPTMPSAPAALESEPDGLGSGKTDLAPRGLVLSPLVRRLAAQNHLDLGEMTGSGEGGRITRADVEALIAPAGPKAVPVPVGDDKGGAVSQPKRRRGEEVFPITRMRKAIAEHMVASLHETARAWNTVEVDMGRVGLLKRLAGPAFKAAEGRSLTWTPFVAKATVQTLLEFPEVNSTWNNDGTITNKHFVNLGIAVALEGGLIVPVIRKADEMTLLGLARSIFDIAGRARTKKLSPQEVTDGTFTITNPGPFGSVMSVPIINRGQAAILAFDAIVKRPVVLTDEYGQDSVGVREMAFISLSWDHRIIDGAQAAKFLGLLKTTLEEADYETDLAPFLPEA